MDIGPLLIGTGSTPSGRLLRAIQGSQPQFLPYTADQSSDTKAPLYELVVSQDAADAPPDPFISNDGFWHTGDLFEEITPSDGGPKGWAYRGRSGDWIKTTAGFCDTK